MILNSIHNRFFVLKVSLRFDLTRYVLMAIMLTISMTGFTQNFFRSIETNLHKSTNSPYQYSAVIAKKKVKTMHHYLVDVTEFNDYLEDSLKKPVPAEENEAYKIQFNLKGQAIIYESNMLSHYLDKMTYSESGDRLTCESYRLGTDEWQSKEFLKYDAQHRLIQEKDVYNDYYTGELDEVRFFDLVWKNNYQLVEEIHKATVELGVKTDGKIRYKATYYLDQFGSDTLYIRPEYNEE